MTLISQSIGANNSMLSPTMTDLEEPSKNNDKFSRVEGNDEEVCES